MGKNSTNLLYFVQGNTCFLLNEGGQAISELEFDSASMGFEDGFVVGDDYGRYRVRDFAPHTFFKVYEMTREDIIYLPRIRWFQLDIHRCVMVDGTHHGKLILNSEDKYGGYTPAGVFVDLVLEMTPSRSKEQ